jgi:hypothetical protein
MPRKRGHVYCHVAIPGWMHYQLKRLTVSNRSTLMDEVQQAIWNYLDDHKLSPPNEKDCELIKEYIELLLREDQSITRDRWEVLADGFDFPSLDEFQILQKVMQRRQKQLAKRNVIDAKSLKKKP